MPRIYETGRNHPRFVDIAGQRFGRLVVLSLHDKKRFGYRWLCQCECGNQIIALGVTLRRGHIQSCGCLQPEIVAKLNRKHGHAGTYAYNSWCSMLSRCNNPKDPSYEYYGGRGIKVYPRWRENFEDFLADMGPRSRDYSLERINNNGDYEPSNCKWIPKSDQGKNRRHPRPYRKRSMPPKFL